MQSIVDYGEPGVGMFVRPETMCGLEMQCIESIVLRATWTANANHNHSRSAAQIVCGGDVLRCRMDTGADVNAGTKEKGQIGSCLLFVDEGENEQTCGCHG